MLWLEDRKTDLTRKDYEKDGERHFRRACCGRTRADGFNLKRKDSGWM